MRNSFLKCSYFLSFCLFAQNDSQQESLRTAKELMESKNYSKAVPFLEDAVQKRGNSLVPLELLGTAYLYSSSDMDQRQNLQKAETTMLSTIDAGGKAVFRAGLGHDRIKGKNMVDTIGGQVNITKETFSFVSDSGSDSFSFPLADIRACALSTGYGKEYAAYHVKGAKSDHYFRPYHFRREEGELVCKLATRSSTN